MTSAICSGGTQRPGFAAVRLQRGAGGDADDLAGAARQHGWQHPPAGHEGGAGVACVHGVPIVQGGFVDEVIGVVAADRVHEAIDLAESIERALDRDVKGVGVGHIDALGEVVAVARELREGAAQGVGVADDRDDLGAGLQEGAGDGLPEAARGSGHQDHLMGEVNTEGGHGDHLVRRGSSPAPQVGTVWGDLHYGPSSGGDPVRSSSRP